jgi:hypothetical protein
MSPTGRSPMLIVAQRKTEPSLERALDTVWCMRAMCRSACVAATESGVQQHPKFAPTGRSTKGVLWGPSDCALAEPLRAIERAAQNLQFARTHVLRGVPKIQLD